MTSFGRAHRTSTCWLRTAGPIQTPGLRQRRPEIFADGDGADLSAGLYGLDECAVNFAQLPRAADRAA